MERQEYEGKKMEHWNGDERRRGPGGDYKGDDRRRSAAANDESGGTPPIGDSDADEHSGR